MPSSGPVSGMAASIRAATESEVFDLAGNNVETIKNTIEKSFDLPFELSQMIRITFVTGAGKLARQRYDSAAAKTVMSTLRDLGYEDDKGASCTMECGGLFKQQHDTGKNLYTVVVFPKMKDVEADMSNGDNSSQKISLLEDGSPSQMIAMSSIEIFTQMITSRCPSWSQKKNCLKALGEIKQMLVDLDKKLLTGTPLDDSEQDFYDDMSMDSLTQKETLVKSKMQKHVEDGNITALERRKLADQVYEKIQALDKEIKTATEEKKPKKVTKLTLQREKLTERDNMLKNIVPKAPHPLKFESDILKLRKEMQPLIKLEKDGKGRLLTLKETTLLARKEEILEEIEVYEYQSCGWFEDDEHFQQRVNASRSAATKMSKSNASKKSTGASRTGGASNKGSKATGQTKWMVPGPKGGAKKSTTSRKTTKSATNAFAAMMMDSDSDSD
jgi:hypothetical protein